MRALATARCPDGCAHFSAVPGIAAVAESCTPSVTVAGHSPSGATTTRVCTGPLRTELCFLTFARRCDAAGSYVSTAQSTQWTLASLYVSDMADVQLDWFCAQACFGEESAAEVSGQWLPGAVVPEEQCWATSETMCSVRCIAPCAFFCASEERKALTCASAPRACLLAGGDRCRNNAEGQRRSASVVDHWSSPPHYWRLRRASVANSARIVPLVHRYKIFHAMLNAMLS